MIRFLVIATSLYTECDEIYLLYALILELQDEMNMKRRDEF